VQQVDCPELVKEDVLALYKEKSEKAGIEPHVAFVSYLEKTYDENDHIDIVIHGNHKYMFSDRITDNQLMVICATLDRYALFIEDVDLRYNQITDVGAKALGDLISKSPRLLGLNLQGNHIKSEGAQYLAEALKECTLLQTLNLNLNKIKTNGAMMVTELLFTHDKLLSLNLGNNKIDHDGVIGILSVLNSSNYTLEELNIDNPVYKTICQSVAIHFGKMFQNNVGLQKLSIRKHKLRDDGIYIIMEHLLENNTLKVLDLNSNEIAFKGCEAISKYLRGDNCSLESLHLANNKCADYGAKAIAQALAVNKSLIHIDMTYNNVNDMGLTMFAQSLSAN
jgi:NLR family CARD domain-containing protein 3